jgi:RimJ/RimL family protein N-acetyltransferase
MHRLGIRAVGLRNLQPIRTGLEAMAAPVEGRVRDLRDTQQSVSITTIEDLTQPHFGLVAAWLSKAEINRWLTAEWRGRVITATLVAMMVRSKKNRVFLVRCDGQPLGLTALADIETADATAMVWYLLGDTAFSGRGIVTEAVREMVRKCFQELKLESLYAWTMEDNLTSTRVLKKVGFREAGRIRRAACSNGRQVDRIYFDLLASECQAI